jgi:hypothetical protein
MKTITQERKKLYDAWYGLLRRYAAKSDCAMLSPRWRESFAAFCADVGSPPASHAVLCLGDRRLGFRPGNVFWGTPRQRQQNVAHAHILELHGRRLSLTACARELGILPRTLRERLAKTSPEKALVPKLSYEPPRRRPKSVHRSSPFVGVYRKGKKWQASIKLDGELHYLGLFLRETDAARAVERARLERQAVLHAKRLATADPAEDMLQELRTLLDEARQAVAMSPLWPPPGNDLARKSSKLKINRQERIKLQM